MNRKKIKIVLAGLTAMSLITSCMDKPTNQNQNQNKSFAGVGDVLRREGSDHFDIVMDNYDTVRTLNTSTFNPEIMKTGKRIYFTADIKERNHKKQNELLKGNLLDFSDVEVKKPLLLSEVKDDITLGDDNIDVRSLLVSGKYLNTKVAISQNDGTVKHTISYVIDDMSPEDKGVLNVRIRHNENGDIPMKYQEYMISCDILKYLKEAPNGKLKVNVHYDTTVADDQIKTYEWLKPDNWDLANK